MREQTARLHFCGSLSLCLLVGIATTPPVGMVAAMAAGACKDLRNGLQADQFAAWVAGNLVGCMALAVC